MPAARVSAALIVRNEAAFFGGCLDSLRGKVDEVVVVDTGSTDDTAAIASARGISVIRFDWIDDFSAARNRALAAATGDWILYIDADELLEARRPLCEAVSAPGYAGFWVRFRPKLAYSPYHEMRLFKADPRIRFEGRMHERVLPSVERICRSDGLRIGAADAAIQHLGYEGDQTAKHVRNLPLLVRAVADDPDRVYLRWHLGETLAASSDRAGAIEALRGALATARRTCTPRGVVEGALAAQSLARLFLEGGESQEALGAADQGLELRPTDPALAFLKGRALVDLGRLDEALVLLMSLPLDDPSSFFDPNLAYDLRIFSEWPQALIGLIKLRQGLYREAEQAYRAASVAAPMMQEYAVKAALAAARSKGS